jgi:hypothetical protein
MAKLTLHSMKCVKLQDSISEDEIEVLIGGVKVGGPYGVHKGGTVDLEISRTFEGTTSIQLREMDANSASDNLGVRTVNDKPVASSNLNFDAAKHAFYTLHYSIAA